MWPNKGEIDMRPTQNSPYKRVNAVMPITPFVPKGAVGELKAKNHDYICILVIN